MNPDDENAPATEEVQEQPVEQTEAPQEQAQDTESAEQGDETVETSQVTEEEPAEEIDWSQYVPDVTGDIPTDESGQVDPVQFRQQLKNELRFEQQEVRSWMQLESKYPEIRKDAGLREMILANRMFQVQRGGQGTLEAAANDVFSRLGIAKNEGKASQQASITVQKSAALQKPTGTRSAAAPDTRDRIRQGDTNAIQSQLTAWLNEGKI